MRYRYRGRPTKFPLGPALIGAAESDAPPELDTPLSLAAARELATRALREVQAGRDPAAEKRARREQQHAAQADTLRAISEEFLRRAAGRLRTIGQRRADLELFYQPLGQLPIDQIKRGQYMRVLDHVADERGLVRADRALSAMKALLNWYAERSDYVSVLGRGGRRTSVRERARSRVPNDNELKAIWLAAEQDKGPFGPYLQFTLLTGTRRGESAGLRRSELSPDGRTWVLPASRCKIKRDVLIPLSRAAQAIIAAQPVLAGGDHIFSVDGRYALGDFASRKKKFDAACGVGNWVIHDLRRACRTLMSRAGISTDIAEQCLGHVLGGIRGTYDLHTYESEKRHAFEALARMVEGIVRPPADIVVPIRRPKSARRK